MNYSFCRETEKTDKRMCEFCAEREACDTDKAIKDKEMEDKIMRLTRAFQELN